MTIPEYRAFYDRQDGSYYGKFSIRHRDGDFVVEKLICRSGQPGHTHTSWTVARSPIPYGSFNLNTKPNNYGQLAGARGIGECFPVDNCGDRYTIYDPKNKRRKRTEICLHEENAIPGSLGCIVVVYHQDWLRVRDFLRGLSARLPVIPLEVL